MKWVKVSEAGKTSYGVIKGEVVQLSNLAWGDILAGKQGELQGEIDRKSAKLLNPVAAPGKIVCVGLNYMDHIRETNTQVPEKPLLFTKFTSSLNGPYSDIVWSTDITTQVDFEAELAVIIGRTCRRVTAAASLDYVAGYTAANDVSAREVQLGDGQWIRGKSLDTFCPLGPTFVTAADIPDPQNLTIRCLLNNEVMQDSNTSEMIFSVAEIIAFCSQSFTLEPGDVILTGTPHGVGLGRDPKVWMQDGDVIVVEIEKIGRLQNNCRIEQL